MLRVPSFAELVGDESEFVSRHFNRWPCFRRLGLQGDPRQILSIADMDEIIQCEALRSSYLRVIRRGVPANPGSYANRVPDRVIPFDDCVVPEKIYEHFRAGATITRNGMNHFRPNLRALARDMTERFSARTDIVVFLTPAGQQGFEAHHDSTDTYVLQLEGSKHWQVWPTPEARCAGVPGRHAIEDLGEPIMDMVMRPGDVLYMPFGTPHVAMAQDEVSLHVTVVVETRMWSQLLFPLVQRLLGDDREFWDVPYFGDPASGEPAELEKKIEDLIGRLRDVDAARELDRLAVAGRAMEGVSQDTFFHDVAKIDNVTEETLIRVAAAELTFHETAGDNMKVTIDGNTVLMPASAATALKAMKPAGTGGCRILSARRPGRARRTRREVPRANGRPGHHRPVTPRRLEGAVAMDFHGEAADRYGRRR
jgi:hypothetical protein